MWEKVRGVYLKFILYLNNFYIQTISIWHHLIEQSFSFKNLFYKLRYDNF